MVSSCWTRMNYILPRQNSTWWRHQMETFSALLAICAGNSRVPGEFPAQRPVTRSFDVFFDLRLNKLLSKQSWGWWFETLSHPLWRQCNGCLENNSSAVTWREHPSYCRTTVGIRPLGFLSAVGFCKPHPTTSPHHLPSLFAQHWAYSTSNTLI